jgi:hypothetical protein
MGLAVSFDDRTSLSTTVAGPRQRRLALAVVLISTVLFLIAAPFAKVPLRPVAAFIPVYETALFLIDLITAVLLFGQFAILRSRALLVLASGYLFTSTMTVVHALSFPGLFSPTGLLGAGPQTTVWLYVFWHVGFALFVIAFALLRDDTSAPDGPDRDPRVAIVSRIFFRAHPHGFAHAFCHCWATRSPRDHARQPVRCRRVFDCVGRMAGCFVCACCFVAARAA